MFTATVKVAADYDFIWLEKNPVCMYDDDAIDAEKMDFFSRVKSD